MATTTVQVSSTASGGVTTTTTTTAAGGMKANGVAAGSGGMMMTNPLNPNDPNAKIDPTKNPQNAQLSKNELDRVTEVFKMYETGLREATIYPRDLAIAMKKLGLNPTETEIQDLINEVEINGFIYYPAFCRIIMRKLREDDDENFHQELFRTLIGPKSYPDGVTAPLYNVNKEFLSMEQFKKIMTNLPEFVDEAEIEDMFNTADRDSNGRITYREFKRMCEVSKPEPIPDKPIDTDETLANDAAKAEANANKKKKKDKKNRDKEMMMMPPGAEGTPIEKKQTVVITK